MYAAVTFSHIVIMERFLVTVKKAVDECPEALNKLELDPVVVPPPKGEYPVPLDTMRHVLPRFREHDLLLMLCLLFATV